jgi:homoserine dehydrogenase
MMQDHKPMRVAVVGLGTVGTGVIRLLDANRDLIARRAGRPIEVRAVNARDRNRDRGVDISRFDWVDDMMELARRDDDRCCGRADRRVGWPGPALARAALEAGKPFVTANKAMLAHHGLALAGLAEKSGIPLKYEAAVAGGIPVIKGLREGAAANEISRVYGILNGTCNYILTTMEKEGRDFGEVLKEAQELGYAEADPSFDVDGVDAAHKLSILASLAFGTQIDFGVRRYRAASAASRRRTYAKPRALGLSHPAGRHGGESAQRSVPARASGAGAGQHPLANVDGSLNAVLAEGNFVGSLFFSRARRGRRADRVCRGRRPDRHRAAMSMAIPFAMQVAQLAQAPQGDSGDNVGRVYLRFMVRDKPGVLAEIAAAMRDAGVSIESVIQRGAHEDGSVLLVVVTHDSSRKRDRASFER